MGSGGLISERGWQPTAPIVDSKFDDRASALQRPLRGGNTIT